MIDPIHSAFTGYEPNATWPNTGSTHNHILRLECREVLAHKPLPIKLLGCWQKQFTPDEVMKRRRGNTSSMNSNRPKRPHNNNNVLTSKNLSKLPKLSAANSHYTGTMPHSIFYRGASLLHLTPSQRRSTTSGAGVAF